MNKSHNTLPKTPAGAPQGCTADVGFPSFLATRTTFARISENHETEDNNMGNEIFDEDDHALPIYSDIKPESCGPNSWDPGAYWRMPPSLSTAFAAIEESGPSISGPYQYFPVIIPAYCSEFSITNFDEEPVPRSPTLRVDRPEAASIVAASTKPAAELQKTANSSIKPKPVLDDVIFVSIDFEAGSTCAKEDNQSLSEIGIATLDTRDVNNSEIVSTNTIISRQYYVEKNYDMGPRMLCPPQFLFGKQSIVSLAEDVRILKRLLYLDGKAPEETRKVVLVGHGFNRDLKVMKRLGLDVEQAPCLLDIIDTSYLAMEVYGRSSQPRLERLVEILGISGKNFHTAGNDTNFTLRAMLLLACRGSKKDKWDKPQLSKVWKYLSR